MAAIGPAAVMDEPIGTLFMNIITQHCLILLMVFHISLLFAVNEERKRKLSTFATSTPVPVMQSEAPSNLTPLDLRKDTTGAVAPSNDAEAAIDEVQDMLSNSLHLDDSIPVRSRHIGFSL